MDMKSGDLITTPTTTVMKKKTTVKRRIGSVFCLDYLQTPAMTSGDPKTREKVKDANALPTGKNTKNFAKDMSSALNSVSTKTANATGVQVKMKNAPIKHMTTTLMKNRNPAAAGQTIGNMKVSANKAVST